MSHSAASDPIAVYDVQQIIVNLRKSGLAIMITDHNVRETLSIVDRAYLIFDGRVESEGTKDFLIDDPISRQRRPGRERFQDATAVQRPSLRGPFLAIPKLSLLSFRPSGGISSRPCGRWAEYIQRCLQELSARHDTDAERFTV